MATRTNSRSNNRSGNRSPNRASGGGDRSAFSWGSPGVVAGVALGGVALAIAANLGRKLAIQSISAVKGNWADSLAAEHDMVLALFDKALATEDSQTVKRKLLLMQIGHALDKHAYAEEHVIYPVLRETNDVADAEELEKEHGEVKEFLYRLTHMGSDSPEWIPTMSEFRTALKTHAALEEHEIFPRLRSEITEEIDARLTSEVNKAGFMMA